LKKRAKKAAAADKLEKLKTGGGTYVVQVDQTGEKLLSMLGNTFYAASRKCDVCRIKSVTFYAPSVENTCCYCLPCIYSDIYNDNNLYTQLRQASHMISVEIFEYL